MESKYRHSYSLWRTEALCLVLMIYGWYLIKDNVEFEVEPLPSKQKN